MSEVERPDNQWLADAIERAKQSALPLLLQSFVDPDDENGSVEALCDVVELGLLAITGDVTEEKLRSALRSIAEPLAAQVGVKWETLVDAILGTLEWVPPDKSTHVLDSWGH